MAFKATAFKSHGWLGRTRKVAVIFCVIVDRREIIISHCLFLQIKRNCQEQKQNKGSKKKEKKKEKERKNKNDKARALASNPERCASLIPDDLG